MNSLNRRSIIVGHANTLHDPSIAIVEGDNIFAEAFERHMQCKRAFDGVRLWYSWRTVRKALSQLGQWPIANADVAMLSSWEPQSAQECQARQALLGQSFFEIQDSYVKQECWFQEQLKWVFLDSPPGLGKPPDSLERFSYESRAINHHLAHAANAVFTSPFDECVVMVLDGTGEDGHSDFFYYDGDDFQHLSSDSGSHNNSLGFLYGHVTALCGFIPLEGEHWKVMGLAAYGKLRRDVYDFFRLRIIVDGLKVCLKFDASAWCELAAMVGGFRNYDDPNMLKAADLAHSFQRAFEDAVIDLCQNLFTLNISKNLSFVGGCALNSSLNGKILARTGFERLHVPSAPADDGNSLGVALYERYVVRREHRDPRVISPYLGTALDMAKLERVLKVSNVRHEQITDESTLCSEVTNRLIEGKVIGWMQGRAEFGPRALGNRSILADPRSPSMKDYINNQVKFREEYRPLAPSILHEFGHEYFEDYAESPYMERTLSFREEVKGRVPAVVHEDGTGRLQTVKREWNPLFHHLIQTFYDKTGIPILLNTSFNVMGKPIIHTVEDAITTLYTTGLHCLVIGNFIIYK